MQPSCQQLRTDLPASLKRYRQQVRRKLKELPLLKLSRLLSNFSDRAKQNVDGQRGRVLYSDTLDAAHYRPSLSIRGGNALAPSAQRLPDHGSRRGSSSSRTLTINTPLEFPDPNVPVLSNTSRELLDLDKYLSSGLDIILKLPGDGPEQTHQAAASLDTQLVKVNLMRREVWEGRLNDEGRGHLELDHDAYVTTMKSDPIPIIGVARGVEWHFKNGSRTYTSDFHVIEMERFDVLLGSDTIRQYQLVELGPDVRRHLQVEKTRAGIMGVKHAFSFVEGQICDCYHSGGNEFERILVFFSFLASGFPTRRVRTPRGGCLIPRAINSGLQRCLLSSSFTTDSDSVRADETVSIVRAQGLNAFAPVADDSLPLDLHNLNDSLTDKTRATVTTSASNPKGYGLNVTLHAIIDETIEENLISRKRLEQLQDWLKVLASPLGFAKALRDSCGVSYEAQSRVCLLVKPYDGPRTEAFWFYIAETETAQFAGGHDIILTKSWDTKFPMDTQDGRKTYSAAPTVYRKGKTKEWEKNASDKSKKNLEEATIFEAEWEKDAKEQKEKQKGPSNGQ
ncbi:hypothetical protein BDW71DRAFT_212632 [Aspergillus fruticulosus]